MSDLETMLFDFPEDTPPFSVESVAHKRMIETICKEQLAQKLVERAANPNDLLAAFTTIEKQVG